MPTNEPRPTKAVRRDEARAKAAQMRAEQERKAKRNRMLAIGGLVVAVLALGAVVFFIVNQSKERAEAYGSVTYGKGEEGLVAPALADVQAPAPANDEGGIPVSSAGVGEQGDDDTVLSIYFDFMCPVCGQFEQANGEDVKALTETDGVTVAFHPLAFLDRYSQGTFYSTRAANAYAVVADQSPEHLVDFMSALYAEDTQPAEGSSGLTDAEIAEIAQGVGVPADVTGKFTSTVTGTYEVEADGETTEKDGEWRTFAPWVQAAYASASEQFPDLGTPYILIDGVKWEGNWQQPGALRAAVEQAAAAKG